MVGENPAGQQEGIYMCGNYTVISKNLFKNQVGSSITLRGQDWSHNIISENTIISPRLTIEDHTANNKILKNNIQVSSVILREETTNNFFYENSFSGEIYFPNTITYSPGYNNTFYKNNFLYSQPVRMDSLVANSWDNDSIGNYWSDYSIKYADAKEVGNTGTANTPYVQNSLNIDNRPLINQVNIEFLSPLPTPISPPANLRNNTQTTNLTTIAASTTQPTPTATPKSPLLQPSPIITPSTQPAFDPNLLSTAESPSNSVPTIALLSIGVIMVAIVSVVIYKKRL